MEIQERIEQAQQLLAAKTTQASGVAAGGLVGFSQDLTLTIQILTAMSLSVLIISGSIDIYRKIRIPKKPQK